MLEQQRDAAKTAISARTDLSAEKRQKTPTADVAARNAFGPIARTHIANLEAKNMAPVTVIWGEVTSEPGDRGQGSLAHGQARAGHPQRTLGMDVWFGDRVPQARSFNAEYQGAMSRTHRAHAKPVRPAGHPTGVSWTGWPGRGAGRIKLSESRSTSFRMLPGTA